MFLLTSREDPLPSVVLEAMSGGIPTLAFENTGGVPDLLKKFGAGTSIPLGDVTAMANAIPPLVALFDPPRAAALAQWSREAFSFDSYCGDLLALAIPDLTRVSVVVPSYNYAHYLPQRLASIFAQTYPVHEIIVLDDASDDDSLRVVQETSLAWERRVDWRGREVNSGSAFHQWRRAAETARGDWLWIAEADDLADPLFLETLVRSLAGTENTVLAFSDSARIDGEGKSIGSDYKAYYEQASPGLLRESQVFDGPAFLRTHLSERNLILNVSAVLWRRDALLAALKACEAELATFSVAGDWRMYAELLAEPGVRVSYVATPLNIHRRHHGSVTARQGMQMQRAEVARMHRVLAAKLGPDRAVQQRQRQYRRLLDHSAT